MPRATKKAPYQEVILTEIERKASTIARGMAERIGPTAFSERLSEKEIAFFWHFTVPGIDVATLRAQGITIEEITRVMHPHRERMIKNLGGPSWQGQVDAAEKIAKIAARYPPEPLAHEEPMLLGDRMGQQMQEGYAEPTSDDMTNEVEDPEVGAY